MSCEMIWQMILLKMCYIFCKASMQLISLYWLSKLVPRDLYFCMSLERSMSCSWTSMCTPRTDLYKQTNKILNSSISAKDSFKSIFLLPWMQYRPHVSSLSVQFFNQCSQLCVVCLALQRQSFEMCFPTGRHLPIPWTLVVFLFQISWILNKYNWNEINILPFREISVQKGTMLKFTLLTWYNFQHINNFIFSRWFPVRRILMK